MSKKTFLTIIRVFILLSPLPFGCVGKVFSPLFYLVLLVISFAGLTVKTGTVKSAAAPFAFYKKIKMLTLVFFGFLVFQIVPLPLFLVKIISPATVVNYFSVSGDLPAFMSLSMVPYETVLFGLRMAVLILFFLAFIRIDLRMREMISVVNVLILSAALQALFGIIKYSLKTNKFFLLFHEIEKSRKVEFLTGTIGNTNHFAFYLEMVIPLVLAVFLLKIKLFESGGGFREKLIATFSQDRGFIVSFILAIILSVTVVLTGSRAGIMTMVTTFILFGLMTFYMTRSKVFRKKIKVIFITIAAVTFYVGIKNTADKVMRTNFDQAGRFLRWPNSMEMFRDFPVFGTGFGTYKYAFRLYDTDTGGQWSTNAHNEYLETLTDGGVAGAAVGFIVLGLLLYSIIRMWKVRRHPRIKLFGIGIISAVYAALFHSFFDYSLRIPSNSFVFILLLGLGIRFVTYRREFSESGIPVRRAHGTEPQGGPDED